MTWVQLVLCRHSENISWALQGLRYTPSAELVIYNNGEPTNMDDDGIPDGQHSPSLTEISIPNVGREAFCYLTHLRQIQETAARCGASCTPAAVVFSQAMPDCSKGMTNVIRDSIKEHMSEAWCRERVLQMVRALASGATLRPRGFVDLDPGRQVSIYPTPSFCWREEIERVTGSVGYQIFTKAGAAASSFHYSPTAQFAVSRANLLATPRSWVESALAELNRSKPLPWLDMRLSPGKQSLAHQWVTSTVRHSLHHACHLCRR